MGACPQRLMDIAILRLSPQNDEYLPPSPQPSPSRALLSMINYFVMLNLVQHLTNMTLYLFSGKIPKQVRDDIFVYSLFHILFSHNIYLHSFPKFLYKIILDNSAEHGREHFCYSSSLSRNFLITNH